MKGRWRLAIPLAVVSVASIAGAAMPVFQEVAAPSAYGRVVLRDRSNAAGVPPVVFEHWRHRPLYSCRLCHVDVGFVMKKGESQISRSTNAAGMHCGACHDGTRMSRGKPVFAACSPEGPFEAERCDVCHALGVSSQRTRYSEFTKALPMYAGGYVDWEVAEARGLIAPQDFLEGVSIPRNRFKIDRDVPIEVRGTWLGKVIFSHKKHATWNGCEVCHPEIFPNTRRGSVAFSMADVNAGRYCGVCHRNVAFPLAQCKRCHEIAPRGPSHD